MVHIDIRRETKQLVNKCRGEIQRNEKDLINYDKTLKTICQYYLNSKGGK